MFHSCAGFLSQCWRSWHSAWLSRRDTQLLGISRSYVSRIEKKALHKLEEALRDRR